MAEAAVVEQPVSTESKDKGQSTQGTANTGDAKSGGQATAPQTINDVIAELEAKDFDKLLPIKDEKGQVQKVKVKDLVKGYYSANTQARKAKEQIQGQIDATVQELVNYAKSSPQDFLQRLGIDPYQFSESTLKQKVAMLEMSPEQRRLAELETELKKRDHEANQRKQHEESLKLQHEEAQEVANLDKSMTEAFKESGLPRKKFFFQWASAIMHDSLVRAEREQAQKGYVETQPLSARDAIGIVKDKFPALLKEAIQTLPVNQLRELLGEDILEKIRQDNIARVTNQSATKKPVGTPTKKAKDEVFTRDEDFRAWVESKKI